MITLHLNLDNSASKSQNMKTAVYTNATVGICLLVVLTSLVGISNNNPDSLNYAITEFKFLNSIDSCDVANSGLTQKQSNVNMSRTGPSHISKRPGLGENLPLLNGLYTVVVATMVINAVLFYFQLWKPIEQQQSEYWELRIEGTQG